MPSCGSLPMLYVPFATPFVLTVKLVVVRLFAVFETALLKE
jgi:hypothetical protein